MRVLRIYVLLMVFACPVFAGDIQNGITPPPPGTSAEVVEGEMLNGITSTLTLMLQSVLSFF